MFIPKILDFKIFYIVIYSYVFCNNVFVYFCSDKPTAKNSSVKSSMRVMTSRNFTCPVTYRQSKNVIGELLLRVYYKLP